MADERNTQSPSRRASPARRAQMPATRAQARARVRAAIGPVGPDLAAAAARAVAELRLGFAARGAEIGFLDDVVDFTHDVVEATAELLTLIVDGPILDIPVTIPDITDATLEIIGGSAHAIESAATVDEHQPGASAQQLLEIRTAILDATARDRKALAALRESLRAQIAALRQPTTSPAPSAQDTGNAPERKPNTPAQSRSQARRRS